MIRVMSEDSNLWELENWEFQILNKARMPVIKLAYGLFPTGYYNAARNYRNAKSRINISINMHCIHFFAHCSRNNQHVILVKIKERKGSSDE